MRKLSLLLSALLLTLAVACGGGGSTPPPPPPPAPTITSFTAAKATLTSGDGTTLTAVFANGTGSVSGGVGAVTSGTAINVTPSATTIYTLTVTNSASQSVTQTTTVTVVATPIVPVVSAPANVTANQTGYTAATPAQAGTSYAWTLTNGTVTAGAGTNSITFTAGATGSVDFSCVATNAAGTASAAGTGSSAVVAAPITPVITAPANVAANATGLTASVPAQSGSTYAWTISGGAITAGATTNQITFTAGASGSVSLGCIVANAAGTASTQGTATSTIVAAPTTPVITAPASVTANLGGYTASTPAQTGVTFAWTLTGGTVTAGAGTNSITFTAGASGTVGFSCVATNSVGTASTAGTATATIVAAPTTPVITAPANVTANATGLVASTPAQTGVTFAWTLTGGTVTAGAGTNNITFTAGASGTVGFSCLATNAAGTASTAGTASSTIVSGPTTPVITAPANVTANQGGYTASTPAQTGVTFAWTLTGGTVNTGAGTNSITFTAGASGTVGFSCVATNGASVSSAAGLGTSTIVGLPSTPVITAPANVTANQGGYTASTTAQTGSTYAWTITGGTITAGATTASITFTAGASGSVIPSCIVTNSAGTASAAGTATSTIVAAPTSPVVTTPAFVTASRTGLIASTPAQTGSTYAWTITGGTITAGATTTTLTFTAGASGSVIPSCIVTNAAGTASAAGTATSTIVAALTPVVTTPAFVTASQVGYTASVTPLTGTSYAWSITGGTITSATTGTSVTFTAGASGSAQLTCVVSNAASDTFSASATSTIVAAPSISAFTASPTSIAAGSGSILAATFTGVSGVITPGSLAITSGGTQNVTPAATTTYTLTVTNAAGTTTTATTTVTVTAAASLAITSFTATPTSVVYGGSSTLNWVLTGTPSTLTLDGANVFGATTAPATPVRRQAYTLQASDGVSTVAQTVKVPARGLDLLAGLIGTPGGGSQDGQGANARFSNPQGVAIDASGNVYVADTNNYTIRKITATGLSSTLAGTPGVVGNTNGTGAAAAFNGPASVAVDVTGNVYVADSANNAIRKITTAGVVSTFAGATNGLAGATNGTGNAARFNNPTGVAVDVSGNVYVADNGNQTIRKITSARVVTTLAGGAGLAGSTDATSTAARFSGPMRVAVNSAGNVYVTDSGNYTIRKITPAGVVTTLAGTAGVVGYLDGTGPAAQFDQPWDLSVDASGNVYVVDNAEQLIRKITAAGVVTTLAGTPYDPLLSAPIWGTLDGPNLSASFNLPSGMASDATGNLYVADSANNTLRKVAATGGVSTWAGAAEASGLADGTGTAASFYAPQGTAVDSVGNTYVADSNNNTIRKITPAGVVTTLAGTAGVTGSLDGTGPAAQFSTPWGLCVDAAGNVYVADSSNNTVRKITPAGVVTTLAGLAGAHGSTNGTGSAARFWLPHGVAVDTAGNIFVADSFSLAIRKISPAGVVTTLVAGALGFTNPFGVAVDGVGTVFMADNLGHCIWKISPGGVVTLLAGSTGIPGYADGTGSAALFNTPQALAVDGVGNVYVADTSNSAIRKITPAGVVTTVVGEAPYLGTSAGIGGINYTAFGPLPASIGVPVGIALTPDGDLVVTTNNGVVQITAP